jgi:LacI family transcriptional regulator
MAARNTPAPSRATLRDVADRAGVHPGTASRALNTETRGLVNGNTARRVLDAAEELGYRPNPIARGLKTKRSYTVGVLIPDITNPLFPPMVRGIEDRLGGGGYTALIANTDNDPERERRDWEAMRDRQVDGIITATARSHHAVIDDMVASNVAVVLVNRRLAGQPIAAAVADDRRGIRLAVEHLVELGHRRIAHVAGPLDMSTGRDRHDGFIDAMRASGLEANPDLIVSAETFTEAPGARACRELLGRGVPLTAIVAGNDLIALGCYDVLAERGIECPDEVSVVGFNDMPFAGRFHPPLTTVRIHHYAIGAAAGELMLEQLTDPDAEPRQELLEPELVARGSTAPPPQG